MKQHRENRIRCYAPTGSLATSKLSKNFLISKHNFIPDILKTHWENFLSTYQYSKKKQSFYLTTLPLLKSIGDLNEQKYHRYTLLQSPKGHRREGKNFFYLKKEKVCHYNYLILAKLVDLIDALAQNVQNRVRKLIKINTKYLELEKHFQITVSKNSLFLSWISYLFFGQISQFIKMTSAFLYKSKLISTLGPVWGRRPKNKLEIQNNGNFLFLKCQDFLLLKWYQNKIHAWSYQVLAKSKETIFNQYYNRIAATSHINSILGKDDKLICYLQDETSSTHQNLMRTKYFDKKRGPNGPPPEPENRLRVPEGASLKKILPEVPKGRLRQRYLRLIKNILHKSKVTTQVELIKKLNEIIGNWDTFVINNITKKKSIKLNLILYQLLWRWGLARHRKQKAKWIKNRYWSDLKNFLF